MHFQSKNHGGGMFMGHLIQCSPIYFFSHKIQEKTLSSNSFMTTTIKGFQWVLENLSKSSITYFPTNSQKSEGKLQKKHPNKR